MQKREILSGFAIAVVDRGFVYVGNIEVADNWCIITDARNIRKWGTSHGLGELALNGPQNNTELDPAGSVRVPFHALIHLIDTEQSKWKP